MATQTKTYPISDHFDGKHFFNPGQTDIVKGLSEVLKWKLQGTQVPWPKKSERRTQPKLNSELEPGQIRITWVNHSTFLIQTHRLNILTDPIWSNRTSPFQSVGPLRVLKPGISWDQLPHIDAVLVSHNHYDHMDRLTLRNLQERFQPEFVVPLGNEKHLREFGCQKISEIDWWESRSLGHADLVSATSVRHWSSRTPWDRMKALWCGFVIELEGRKIYFAGDTGDGPHFQQTFEKYGAMDISLIPIGAYEPRWFMKNYHINPEEAVKAHLELHSKVSLGMHFGCFQLTDESIDQPVIDLEVAIQAAQLKKDSFRAPLVGETFLF